jgi:hypothetical protein
MGHIMNGTAFYKKAKQAAATIALGSVFAFNSDITTAQSENDSANPYIHPKLASKSTEEVGVRLVLLFDTSGSIDDIEYQVQLDAMADAIESEDFKNAVFYRGGPQTIAICVANFDDRVFLNIPWVDIREDEDYKFKALAKEIRSLDRKSSGLTHQARAFNAAATYLTNSPWEGKRSVVDIITDGRHNGGGNLQAARENLAKNHDATINALITLDTYETRFEEWAQKNLVTQPIHFKEDGSALDPGFVRVVATQQSTRDVGAIKKYKDAMNLAFRRKIFLEVAGIDLENNDDVRLIKQAPKKDPDSNPSPLPKPR